MSSNAAKNRAPARRTIEVRGVEAEVSTNLMGSIYIHRVGKTRTNLVDRDIYMMNLTETDRMLSLTKDIDGDLPDHTQRAVANLADRDEVLFWIVRENKLADSMEGHELLKEIAKRV